MSKKIVFEWSLGVEHNPPFKTKLVLKKNKKKKKGKTK